MTNPHGEQLGDERCQVCGATLVIGTTDFAEVPGETQHLDEPRTELDPGRMVRTSTCPTPGCPGAAAGAQL